MQTASETRRSRLEMLVKEFGSIAALNEALGMDRTDATLSQIRTQAPHSKTGKPRSMGDPLARRIEEVLHLETGWMDTPPTYSEMTPDDPRAKVLQVMESLPPELWPTAVRLVGALAQQPKNGTNHH